MTITTVSTATKHINQHSQIRVRVAKRLFRVAIKREIDETRLWFWPKKNVNAFFVFFDRAAYELNRVCRAEHARSNSIDCKTNDGSLRTDPYFALELYISSSTSIFRSIFSHYCLSLCSEFWCPFPPSVCDVSTICKHTCYKSLSSYEQAESKQENYVLQPLNILTIPITKKNAIGLSLNQGLLIYQVGPLNHWIFRANSSNISTDFCGFYFHCYKWV